MPELGRELVFTDEQLTLLAILAGEPCFPGAPAVQLDEAGWVAVASGLLARGVLHDDESTDEPHESDAVLGVVLFAARSLWMTIAYAPGAGTSRQEILWLEGDAFVRQTRTPDGFHVFRTGAAAALAGWLEGLLEFPRAAAWEPGEPQSLTELELEDAVELFEVEGLEAAVRDHPAAAGYVTALDDACCVVSVESSHRVGEDRIEGDGLALVESPQQGLWIAREDPWGDGPPGSAVVVQRITPAEAREQVGSLAALLA